MSTSVFEPVRKLLEQTFKDGWASRTPVKYENAIFQAPTGADWVGMFVRWGSASPVSVGPTGRRMERHFGSVVIQVFTAKNSATKASQDHCDFAGAIFRMKTLTDVGAGIEVVLRSPSQSDHGERGEVIQKNVSIAFQVDALF